MDSKFHGLQLPPQKRFRLYHQQQQPERQRFDSAAVAPISLPAKKRKESRDPPVVLHPVANVAAATTYCLPAKKRVWAVRPDSSPQEQISKFDLNVEYNSYSEEASEGVVERKQEEELVPVAENGDTRDIGNTRQGEECEGEAGEACEDDDGIVCAICQSTDGDPSDPIVLCDGCDLMVHASCYGNPLVKGIPEGDWFCAQCSVSISSQTGKSFACCLCPINGGAMKPTTKEGVDGGWAHVVCALYVPEVFFLDPEGREGIDCSKVPQKRWREKCYVCKKASGCAISCSEPKCPLAFHVTCGLKEDLCIEYREGRKRGAIVAGFCKSHTDLWMKVCLFIYHCLLCPA